MSRRQRPTLWQLTVVVAVAAAAIAFVIVMAVGLLRDGVGTGDPLDYWRAVGRGLTDPVTWRIVGLSAALGAGVTALVGAFSRRGGGH
ncbi:hypothetical protein [Isoptericola cucumis]|uniref:Uncharacterized protein n=1 Tax=Isoptericola cucumis TaxID=1776856 RepID=A0ABQ2BCI7_9MICO|nr:hypothetical protein [Isoptericola cucumis]GGI11427.1 hypothetical protein GCM10007368_36140 [Isoptericola cucumis]